MNELPPELRVSPPRPEGAAGHFLAKPKKNALRMILGGTALFPVLVVIFWLNFGDLNAATVGISLGISTLVELMGAALLFNTRKSLQLFRDGTSVMGRVRRATVPSPNITTLEVEFPGATGATRVGSVTVVGAEGATLPEGAPVPVLFWPSGDRRFAIYTPALGMMAGVTAS